MFHISGSTGETRLCADCEGLRFDDEGCGGSIGGPSDDGTPTLKFQEGLRDANWSASSF